MKYQSMPNRLVKLKIEYFSRVVTQKLLTCDIFCVKFDCESTMESEGKWKFQEKFSMRFIDHRSTNYVSSDEHAKYWESVEKDFIKWFIFWNAFGLFLNHFFTFCFSKWRKCTRKKNMRLKNKFTTSYLLNIHCLHLIYV